MKDVVNVVRHLDENLGDHSSTPVAYFGFLCGAEQLDPNAGDFTPLSDARTSPSVVVVGGGGQIANRVPQYDQNLAIVAESSGISIAWGIGHNRHDATVRHYPKYLETFDLVGLRDWGSPYEWVPDASCMLPALRAHHEVTREAVLYEHWQIPSGVTGLPAMKNSAKSVKEVLYFLGSAATVVTNTYHGWYWATLLGRRVVLIEPFSTKFLSLKYAPVIADRNTWRLVAHQGRRFPEALEECCQANSRFAAKVKELCAARGHPLV